MRINIEEHLMRLAEVAQFVPRRNGRKAHVSTIYRWSTIGCHGVVLETLQAGGTRVTSREAVARFFARLTALAQGHAVDVGTGHPASLEREEAEIARDLDAAGI
jgi:hypothetical protein